MKRLLVLAAALVLTGCSDDFYRSGYGARVDSGIAKAVAEQDQLKEQQAQTKLIERQTLALEAIAARCGK